MDWEWRDNAGDTGYITLDGEILNLRLNDPRSLGTAIHELSPQTARTIAAKLLEAADEAEGREHVPACDPKTRDMVLEVMDLAEVDHNFLRKGNRAGRCALRGNAAGARIVVQQVFDEFRERFGKEDEG